MNNPILILYLEDSPRDVELVQDKLQQLAMPHELRVASDRAEYESALAQTRFDLIISDYALPDYDGFAALALALEKQPEVPFILISGTLSEEQAVDCMHRGATDYVIKQNLKRLVPAVLRALSEAEAQHKRRQAEAALRASEQELQTYIDNAGDAIYVVERATGRIQNCNARACHDLGYSRAELLQLATTDIEVQFIAKAVAELHQQQKAGEPRTVTGTHRRKDGTLFPVEIRLSSLAPAQPELIISIVRDITERQRVEQALRESEVEFRTTFEMASIGMAQADPHTGAFQRVNRKMCAITGYTAAELLKLRVRDVTYPDDRQADGQLFQRVIKGAQPDYQIEKRYVRKDGSLVWVSINMTVIRNANGRPVHTMATVEDISARKQAEEAIQRERVLSDTIIDSIPGTFYLLDEHGCYTRWNTFQRDVILGKPDDQMSSMNARDTIHPEDRALIQARIASVLQKGKDETVEGRVLLRGGPAFIWMLMTGRRMTIAGRPFLVGTGIDITARKQAAAALLDEAVRRRILFEQSQDGIVVMNLSGKVCEANRRYAEMLGYTSEEVLHLHIWEWDTQWTREQLLGMLQAVDASGAFIETRHRRKDGSIVDVEISSNAANVAGQKLIFCICRDVTARKRTLEAQARLVTAVEQAAETIVITDTTGTILYANPAFEKITGYTRAEAYGLNPRVLKSGKQEAEFYRHLWAQLTAGQVWHGHFINKRKDGALIEEDATISPVLDATGQIINYVAVKRDVTREMALEERHRQATKMEAVGRLAGGVAHDFNNKLQIILFCVQILLKDMAEKHPFRADLLEIKEAAQRSADLTRQLLTFSRQQVIAPKVLDVNAVIAGSFKMLGRVIGENIQLHYVPQTDLEGVFMDPSQLDQILINLAVNARDAIVGTGQITLAATNRTLTAADCQEQVDFVTPGDYVVLSFRDDGSGMSPEVQAHIFEPFFTTKGVGKGTGLGLATVYGIVKQNHGAILVQSALGQGTTFTLYLPRAKAAALATAAAGTQQMPKGTETVLVTEDEKGVLKLIQRTLEQQGYNVLAAVTPELALQVCAQHPAAIHLLLTDVIMPNMDGKELSARIQKLRPGIRVLFMSGYSADILEQIQANVLPAGLQVLQKPFTALSLALRVRAILDNSTPAPEET